MADQKRAANIADDDGQFDRAGLLRLGAWGLAAVLSLTTTVFAARSDLGARRFTAALAAITASPNDPPQAVIGQLLARTADMEREARRLTDTVRSLTAERERLTMRLGMVEREMGDLTGSISRNLARQAPDAQPAPPHPSTPAPASPPSAAAVPTTIELKAAPPRTQPLPATPPPIAAVSDPPARSQPTDASPAPLTTASLPEIVPLPQPRPIGHTAPQALMEAARNAPTPPAGSAGDTATAAVAAQAAPPAVAEAAQTEEPQPKAEIGLDLGPALSMARLRARWLAFKSTYGSMAEGLRPVISVREMGQNKPVEMRLVVGPVADVYAATQICAALVGTQFVCHPAVFDGQRLALR